MVMLRPYCALIFSQMGCDTFVSGSAAESKLFFLNRVQSTELLAPGAFHSCRLKRLHAESGKLYSPY
jgi:hypothetical protein